MAWVFKEFMKCLITVQKIAIILHLTQKLNVSKFHVCIDSLNHKNEKKKKLFSACYQRTNS